MARIYLGYGSKRRCNIVPQDLGIYKDTLWGPFFSLEAVGFSRPKNLRPIKKPAYLSPIVFLMDKTEDVAFGWAAKAGAGVLKEAEREG